MRIVILEGIEGRELKSYVEEVLDSNLWTDHQCLFLNMNTLVYDWWQYKLHWSHKIQGMDLDIFLEYKLYYWDTRSLLNIQDDSLEEIQCKLPNMSMKEIHWYRDIESKDHMEMDYRDHDKHHEMEG